MRKLNKKEVLQLKEDWEYFIRLTKETDEGEPDVAFEGLSKVRVVWDGSTLLSIAPDNDEIMWPDYDEHDMDSDGSIVADGYKMEIYLPVDISDEECERYVVGETEVNGERAFVLDVAAIYEVTKKRYEEQHREQTEELLGGSEDDILPKTAPTKEQVISTIYTGNIVHRVTIDAKIEDLEDIIDNAEQMGYTQELPHEEGSDGRFTLVVSKRMPSNGCKGCVHYDDSRSIKPCIECIRNRYYNAFLKPHDHYHEEEHDHE